MTCRFLMTTFFLLSLTTPQAVFGAGGTSMIAANGEPVYVSPGWPAGTGELVNDPMRTSGWNSWFSEWPNDVNQYAFDVKSTDDVNKLIKKFASIKSDVLQIRLSHLKEPNGLGWVTRLPEGNDIPVIFSIGDQSVIDEWYKRVRKPFGVMEFTAAPTAVPPTLTIFVRNDVIDLEKVSIPEGIKVSAGYVPTVFHRFNTTDEKKRETVATSKAQVEQPKLDGPSQSITDRITAYLKKREEDTDKTNR